MSTTEQQLLEMMRLQDRFNQIVNPNWRDAGYPYHQAIYVECGEATEHMKFKWWKGDQTPDIRQTWIELVDVWHFGLSMMLKPQEPCNLTGFHAAIRKVIHAATAETPTFHVEAFKEAMAAIGMTETDLYKLYIMKNVLNVFRQNNGYNTTPMTYIKDWGKDFPEDNSYLEHLFENRVDWTFDELYTSLQEKYEEVKKVTYEGEALNAAA